MIVYVCRHPEHKPPTMMVIYKPYCHKCPGCGYTVILYPSALRW